MRCWYRTAETYGGDYLEVDGFSVWSEKTIPVSRRKRYKPTSEVQAAYNKRRSERALVRLIHANYGSSDYSVTLTYDDVHLPDDEDGVKRDARNFLARLRRLYARFGSECKYILVSAKGKRKGRAHHHLIVSGGVPIEDIMKLWTLGRRRVECLQFDSDGVAGLADYIVEQAEIWAKRWCCSRNLVRPEPVIRDDRIGPVAARELADRSTSPARLYELAAKYYPGYQLASVQSQNIVDQYGGAYFTLRLIRADSKHAMPDFDHWSDAWMKRAERQRDGEVDGRDLITVRDGRTNAARTRAAEGTAALEAGKKKRRRRDVKQSR